MSSSTVSEVEQVAVNQLREKLLDLNLDLEGNSSAHLVKWLRAQNLDVDKAAEMLQKSLNWRLEHGMDKILEWDPSEGFQDAFPLKLSGFDEEGNAIMIAPLQYANTTVFWKVSKEEYVKFRCHTLEGVLDTMRRRNKALSLPGNQMILIYDLEGFNLKNLLRPKIAEYLIEASQVIDANYPEISKRVYVTYAPRMITLVAAFFKPFTPKADIEKTKVFGSNVSKWGSELLAHIPPSSLPIRYGGTSSNIHFDQ